MAKKDIPQSPEKGIERILYDACAHVMSKPDAPIYRKLVLALFFLKRLSDEWDEAREKLESEAPDNPQYIANVMRRMPFQLPSESRFQHLSDNRNEPGNAERLGAALVGVEQANLGQFSGMFRELSFDIGKLHSTYDTDSVLNKLLDIMAKPELNLRPSHIGDLNIIGRSFSYLLQHLSELPATRGDEASTPPGVAELMVQLADPQEGDVIYDPCCGVGTMLLHCASHIQKQDEDACQYALFGEEKNRSTWALAKMNLILHNEMNHRLEHGDCIVNPKLIESDNTLKKFDVVLGHLPFAASDWGVKHAEMDRFGRFERGLPPRSKGEFAFIQHMLASLKSNMGRMLAVTTLGVLYRGGSEEEIRRRLIDDNLLDAVIVLPERLFYGTGIPAAILVFRAKKTDQNVLFIDASEQCQVRRRQNFMATQDVEKLVELYKQRTSTAINTHLATIDEIRANEYNLSIQRYIRPADQEESFDPVALQKQHQTVMYELGEIGNRIQKKLDGLGYGNKE